MRNILILSVGIFTSFLFSSSKPLQDYYQEKQRPQYHFTPEKNFMGDPAGLLFYEGEYHLFYQYNPAGKENVPTHLGHAVSNDLIHWKHLPVALSSDVQPADTVCNLILSGNVIIDQENLLGLEQGGNKTFVMFYTGNYCGQLMAYSTDRGKTWQKYGNNPLISYDAGQEARHPRVFWHKPTGKWVMVMYRKLENDSRKQGFSFYNSADLVHWEYQSHLAGFYENPLLLELQVNNRADDTRWVILEGDGGYVTGHFDGKSFTPESIRMKSDFGTAYRAPLIWNNLPANDGRTIQTAAIGEGEWTDMPFSGQLAFPNELALRKINSGIFLVRQPVREIEKLYGKQHKWTNEKLIPGINRNLIKKIQGDCLRIKGRFDLKSCDSFGFMLKAGKKNPGSELMYNVKRQSLSFLGSTVGVVPVDNKITLDILIDRASVEIYVNNGLFVISSFLPSGENARNYTLFNTGGELLVEELSITEILPAWSSEVQKK